MSNFKESLKVGQVGESEIAQFLKSRGNNILPIYEKAEGEFKGPALFAADGREIIAPDMLCINTKNITWIEAKAKGAWSWNRILQVWNTGIDLHHYYQYQEVEKLSEWPVWLFFLQKGGQAKDSPPNSPTGLYARPLADLVKLGRFHKNGGKKGMVYWIPEHFYKISEYPFPDID